MAMVGTANLINISTTKGESMAQLWLNSDGSSTRINSPQDVAAALDKDPETAEVVGEILAKEAEEQ